MEETTEVVETPQNTPQKTEVSTVKKTEIAEEELSDLRHKAEVSSQNFERLKKAEAELAELKQNNINQNSSEADIYSDEGKILKGQLDSVRGELNTLREERELERIYVQYPLLKEQSSKFEEFRKSEHPRAKIESVAKLFLAENGLLEPRRQGLESPTGGTRTPMVYGMTAQEVENLRRTNYKKYLELLKKDQLKIQS